MTGPPVHLPRPLSPDEFEHAQMLSPAQLGKAEFPVVPPTFAPKDQARRLDPNARPDAGSPLTGPARILTKVVSPMLDNPVSTSMTALLAPVPVVGELMGDLFMTLMGRNVMQYAMQKGAEMQMPEDVRRFAEADPERIQGEDAAISAGLIAAPIALGGAMKTMRTGADLAGRGADAAGRGARAAFGKAAEIAQRKIPDEPTIFTGERGEKVKAAMAAGAEVRATRDAMETAVKAHVEDVVDAIDAISPGKQTENIIRAASGNAAAEGERAHFVLDDFRRAIDPLPAVDKFGFIDAIEGGESQPSPVFERAATFMRRTLDRQVERVQALGTGALDHYIQNYFPHAWEDPERAANFFAEWATKRPFEGTKASLKQRTIPTTLDGLRGDLKPKFDNPVDLFLYKVRDMEKYIAAHTAFNEVKAAGFVEWVPAGARPQRPGFTETIDDKMFKTFGPRTGAVTLPEGATKSPSVPGGPPEPMTPEDVRVPGTRVMGEWYAPREVAQPFNNYLSPGLSAVLRKSVRGKWGDRAALTFDAYRAVGNTLNQAQLGLSAFHLGFTSMDATVSRAALGIEYIANGKPLTGMQKIGESFLPGYAPIANARFGLKIRRAFLNPEKASPDMVALARGYADGGGRIGLESYYKNSAPERYSLVLREEREALSEGRYGDAALSDLKAGALFLPAFLEETARPIMEHIVPLQKLGVFGELAQKVLAEMPPETSRAEYLNAMASIVNSVDNRMGQLVYDNLFWHKAYRDLAQASVRSVGWNVGTIRELGGGVADLARAPGRVASGEKAMTHRLAYLIALPIVTGFYGALYQYLRTGEGPSEVKDYFYPKTGEQDADGNAERVQVASYMKDLFAYERHPWQTVKNKVAPLPLTIMEMFNNQDFYGDEIRNPDDPLVKQVQQEATFVLKTLEPFGFRNIEEIGKRGDQSAVTKYGQFVGITPAPREEVRSDAQNRMAEFLAQRHTEGATPEQSEARKTRGELLGLLRTNKGGQNTEQIQATVTKAIESGQLVPADVAKLLKRAGMTPAVEKFKTLTLVQALDVFKRATPAEQARFADALVTKMERSMKATASASNEETITVPSTP